jgi:hypothetical protein
MRAEAQRAQTTTYNHKETPMEQTDKLTERQQALYAKAEARLATIRRKSMTQRILKIIFCIAAIMMTTTSVYSQESKPLSDADYIGAKLKRLRNFADDFRTYMQTQAGNFEGYNATHDIALTLLEAQSYLLKSDGVKRY